VVLKLDGVWGHQSSPQAAKFEFKAVVPPVPFAVPASV
jgi:hypothetical protein